MSLPFTGLLAYPITPLGNDGELDLGALQRLVRGAALAGVTGVSVLATSGAGVTFDRRERRAVVEAAVEAAAEVAVPGDPTRPVYAAISAASTREVVRLAQDAEHSGASGLLLAPFSYLPLSDQEVRSLFARTAAATGLPLCFYNKPLQTHYDLTPETLAVLAETAQVVAVKETLRRDNIAARVQQLRDAVGLGVSLGLSADVQLLSTLPDADAWHTGLAALLPEQYAEVWRKARAGGAQGSSLVRLQTIAYALAGAPHSIGALHALANALGVGTAGPRGPFAHATAADVASVTAALSAAMLPPP